MSRKGHPNELGYVFIDDVSTNPSAPAVVGDLVQVAMYFWDTNALAWTKATGGTATGPNVNVTNFPAVYPSTVADGANVAQGATTDVSGTPTTIGLLKQIASAGPGGSGAGSVNVINQVHVIVDSGGGAGAGSVNVINQVSTIISGTPTVLQGGAPWQVAGSVSSTQGGTWNVGINGTPTVLQGQAPWQVAGSVAATQGGTWNMGITGTPTVLQGTPPWQVAGSVAVTGLGSVNVINNINASIVGTPTVDVRSSGLSSVSVVGNVTAVIGAGTASMGSVNIGGGIQGAVPPGAVFNANPMPNGGRAMWTNPAQVDDADMVAMATDKLGKQIGYPFSPRQLSAQMGSTTSGTGETTFIAAGSTGVFHDLTLLVLSNLGSLSTPTVTIRDRAAGPVIFSIRLGPFASLQIPFSRPWEQTLAANAWTMQLSVAGGSVFVAGQVVKLI